MTDTLERRVLLPGTRRLPAALGPDLRGRSYRIDVALRGPLGEAEGVLLACGDGQAGFALHVADRRLVHTYHHAGRTSVVSSAVLGRPSPPPGAKRSPPRLETSGGSTVCQTAAIS